MQRRVPVDQLLAVGRAPRTGRPAPAAAAAASGSSGRAAASRTPRNSTSPSRPVAAVGRIQLVDTELGAMRVAGQVDQQVAEDAVDQPRRAGVGLPRTRFGNLLEGDLQFVQRVAAALVHARRLAGRADEAAGKQIRQRRMVVPVARPGCAADRVGAGTGCPAAWGRPAPRGCRRPCRCAGRPGRTSPSPAEPAGPPRTASSCSRTSSSQERAGWMLTSITPGSGVTLIMVDPMVGRRQVAFDRDRRLQLGRRVLDGGHQVQVVLQPFDRRHEDVQPARRAVRRTGPCG